MMTALMLAAWNPGEMDWAEAGYAKSLLSMLDARSPGERDGGALAQSKPRRASEPKERTPRNVTPPPPVIEEFAKIVVPPEPAPFGWETPPETLAFVIPPIQPVSVGITKSSVTPVPPTFANASYVGMGSAVPEPGTWLMMLTGFGMVGAAMARSRRRPSMVAA